ncbi:hypothetical protein [Flavihumibacter petaseus]|nr:hypothetical protein [Flavihumibacter petaseus]
MTREAIKAEIDHLLEHFSDEALASLLSLLQSLQNDAPDSTDDSSHQH